MATDRFYFDSVAEPGITPSFSAEWDTTTDAVRRVLNTTKGASALATLTVNEPSTTTDNLDYLAAQFISPQLPAFEYTTDMLIHGQMLTSESNAAANFRMQTIVRVLDDDDTTYLGTLYGPDTAALSDEFVTSLFNKQIVRGGARALANAVSAPDDHRIVVEVGFRAHNTASNTRTAGFRVGENGASDMPIGALIATDLTPWIEIFALTPVSAATGTVCGTDDFAGVSGTELSVYSPNWSHEADELIISGIETARTEEIIWAGDYEWAGTQPLGTEYDVRADVVVLTASGDAQLFANGNLAESPNDVTGWWADLRISSDIIDITYNIGPTFAPVDVASVHFPFNDATTYAVEFRVRDDVKAVYVDGELVASAADNTAVAAGRAGVVIFEFDDVPSDIRSIHLDNWELQDTQEHPAGRTGLRYPLDGLSPRQRTLRG